MPEAPTFFSAWMSRQARRELNWGQAELAHHAGCSLRAVKEFEQAERVTPDDRQAIYQALCKGGLMRLNKLAKILRCEYPILADNIAG